MLRSMNSAIAGLRAHQTKLDVTGNNIANVNTTAFKSSSTQFQDTLSQMVNAAGAPQNGAGGTNPAQVGLGVRTASVNANFSQGAAQNASMVALQRSLGAGALVGQTVSYTDENGASKTGTVGSVRLGTDKSEATAIVGGVSVPMGRITEVSLPTS